MSVLSDALKLAAAGAKLLARAIGFKPGPAFKALRGPFHVYPNAGSVQWEHAPHTCLHCPRYDQAETPYTDPPCPRTKL